MRCPGGASGHETDKISKLRPQNVHLLAKGLNPDDGGAEMVIFDTPSGGAVFSVGSICWPSCCRWMTTCRRSRRTCCGGFCNDLPLGASRSHGADASAKPQVAV